MNVFISKNTLDLDEIPSLLSARGITGIYQSLIRFESIPIKIESEFEVLFFPSIRSAKFLMDSEKIKLSSYILACHGMQTQKRLRELGYTCDFVAENAGNPEEVSKSFSSWLGERKVLVPHSNISSLSVTKHLNNNQLTTLEVYKTVFSKSNIEHCDIYVFSSPSNIQSFFKSNTIKPGSKLIVWGNTSLKSLNEYGYRADFTLKQGSIDELKLLLESILTT